MKELTCPKCNNTQKLGSANICGYCYYKFDEPNKLLVDLAPVESNLSDTQILEILDLKKEPYKNDSSIFFIQVGLFIIISILAFLLDAKLFIYKSFDYFFELSFFFAFFTTYLTYQYLSKSDIIFLNPFDEKDIKFVKFVSLLLFGFFINMSFNFSAIRTFNDFSSIISNTNIYDVFLSKKIKHKYNRNGGYDIYYLNITNWKKVSNTTLEFKVTQAEYDKYQDQKPAKIEVKSGLIDDVVWHIAQ